MALLIPFTCFKNDFSEGVHDLENDTLKLALTAGVYDDELESYSAISLNKTNWNSEDFPELFGSISYPEGGGYVLEKDSYTEVSGTHSLFLKSLQFDCPEGQFFGPFRYLIIYNHTQSDRLIGYFDYTVVKDLNAGETFFVNFAQEIEPAIKVALITDAFILFNVSRVAERSGHGLTSLDPLIVNIYSSDSPEYVTFTTAIAGVLYYSYGLTGTGGVFGTMSVDGVNLVSSSGSLAVTAG